MTPTAHRRPARPKAVSLALTSAFAALLIALFTFTAVRPTAAADGYTIGSLAFNMAMHTASPIRQSFRTEQAGELTSFTYFYKNPGLASNVQVYLFMGNLSSGGKFVNNWSLFPADRRGYITEALVRPVALEANTDYYLELFAPGEMMHFGYSMGDSYPGGELIGNTEIMPGGDLAFELMITTTTVVPPVLNAKVPPATYGDPYTLASNGGGFPQPQYSVSAGALPPGLTLDAATGTISGTPSAAGSFAFTLRAENSAGAVEQAYTLVVDPAPLSIIVMQVHRKIYGNPLPVIAYDTKGFRFTDTSALLSGALSAVEPPSTNGPEATVGPQTPVGSYAITLGTLAANNYSLSLKAPPLVVTPRPLGVGAQSVTIKAGAATPASFALSYDNFAEGEGPEVLDTPPTASVTARPADLEATGSFPIELAGGADANYVLNFAGNAGTLTVTTRDIPVISWGDDRGELPGITYGQALAASLGARASFAGEPVPGTFSYRLMPAATPLEASTVLSAGAGQALEATFTPADPATFVAVSKQVTLDVARAPLLIAADSKAITKGQPLPALTASYKGFVNADEAADLDTPASLSTTATATSPRGIYTINVGGATDANYSITFVAGTLTISAQPATLRTLNGTHGRPGSAFVFHSEGFSPGEEVLVLLRGGRVFRGGQVLKLVISEHGTASFILEFPAWLQPGTYVVEVSRLVDTSEPQAVVALAGGAMTTVTIAESAPLLSAPEGSEAARASALLQWYLPLVLR